MGGGRHRTGTRELKKQDDVGGRLSLMPCLTVVAGEHRAVVAVPATLDGWSNWTVDTLLQEQLPRRLPRAEEAGLLEVLCDRAGNFLPPHAELSSLGLHPGQVLHAVSRDAPFVPPSEDYSEIDGARGWALQAVNLAIRQSDEILSGLEDLRDVASSAASNDGSSTARSERTYAALTGAMERRGEVVDRIDASFDAGLHALNKPSPRSRPVSEWPLAPYTALRGSADLAPYKEHRYSVDNHTGHAPLVRCTLFVEVAVFFSQALHHANLLGVVCSCGGLEQTACTRTLLRRRRTTLMDRWRLSGANSER